MARIAGLWPRLFDAMMRSFVRQGTLTVAYPGGARGRYGAGAPEVTMHVADTATLQQLVRRPDPAMGEAYMDGRLWLDGDDLEGFLTIVLSNLEDGTPPAWRRAHLAWRRLRRGIDQANPLPRAQANVAHHYDLSDALYALFLDSRRQYSCGYFKSPDDDLETAQVQKMAHIAGKLLLEPGMRVLDIGCGWGGLARYLARTFGVKVHGVTLSRSQRAYAETTAAADGLAHATRFELRDYRTLEGPYDRIVSVGMFEHVGAPHFLEYFRTVERLLDPHGVALIHTIGRLTPPGATSPWIAKYIFPGGYTPSLSEVAGALERTRLWTSDVEVWRLHYAYTLRHWHDRFMARADEARALYDDRFVRMWKFYLKICEMAFRYERQSVFQVQLGRRRDAVPITRDYLYADRARALRAAE